MYYPLSVSLHEILKKVSKEEQRKNPIVLKKASRIKALLQKLERQHITFKRKAKYA